jgi:hypothetical protein
LFIPAFRLFGLLVQPSAGSLLLLKNLLCGLDSPRRRICQLRLPSGVAFQRPRGSSGSTGSLVNLPRSLGLSSGFRFLLLLFLPG